LVEYKFVMFKGDDGDWYWNWGTPQEIMARSSEGYKNLADCKSALVTLQKEAKSSKIYKR